MKRKAYIYPITNRLNSGVYNPYLDNFMISTDHFIDYLNRNYPSDTGIFNVLRFIFKVDVIFLNWIEDLPDKKLGIFQSIFFGLIVFVCKILSIKIVWTLHNKISHKKEGYLYKKLMFKFLLRFSDVILTHASEGVGFAEKMVKGSAAKVFYFPHPIMPFNIPNTRKVQPKEIDVLIWGTISPYKGVHKFLEFLEQTNQLNKFSIFIVGKVLSGEFSDLIYRFASDKITIKNEYVSKDELAFLVSKSKTVLFTYSGESVLSSGALIDSLAYRGFVLGPNVGAFADMERIGLALTYNHFSDIPGIIEDLSNVDQIGLTKRIDDFIQNHTWDKFADYLKGSNF